MPQTAQPPLRSEEWTTGRVGNGFWMSIYQAVGFGLEIDLELRPVPMQGWSDIWEAALDLGVECECVVNHGAHYVRRRQVQASITMLPKVIQELIGIVSGWKRSDRDAL